MIFEKPTRFTGFTRQISRTELDISFLKIENPQHKVFCYEKGKNIVELKATINRELKLLLEKSERSALNKNIYIKLKLIPTKSKLLLMKSSQNVNS